MDHTPLLQFTTPTHCNSSHAYSVTARRILPDRRFRIRTITFGALAFGAFVLGALVGDTPLASAASVQHTLASPSGELVAKLTIADDNSPATLEVQFRGHTVLLPSPLGLRSPVSLRFARHVERDTNDTTWEPLWGENATVRDHYQRLTVAGDGNLGLELRAYDEGIAFRYLVKHTGPVPIDGERTEFRFDDNHQVWAVTSAQGKYNKVPLDELKHAIERPCVLETRASGNQANGFVIAIAEAAQVDYARMRLRRNAEQPHTLSAVLHDETKHRPVVLDETVYPRLRPSEDSRPAHHQTTPWRVVMVADSATQLLANNHLILNLNEPCKIADTSWIRPGKVLREVSLSTKGGKACIDFAARYGLQFIEYDAGWYGPERDSNSDARTVSRPNLDLQEVIAYGKQHDVGVLVYVNRRHLETQLDELLPLYKKWGLAGIKYGFVQHGSQKWTAWMHDAIIKTADHGLMVDVHDEYRMSGWQRTYPNFMTSEGIGGDETRPPNEQALANLFTRMIAGPADHTFCYYNGYVDKTTSHAAQLAKTVCFFSPWQFLFWYDRPANANDEPELQFFKQLPTTWDETRIVDGKIGEYAVVARRKGAAWFIGCLNAVEPRTIKVPLDFLTNDRSWNAEIFHDDPSVATKTKVGIERRDVSSTTVLEFKLNERNGTAVIIK